MSGKIEVIVGPMAAGKTEELLRRLKRVELAGQGAMVLKPAGDDRAPGVQSHAGTGRMATPVRSASDVWAEAGGGPGVIAMDEVQFLIGNVARVVGKLADAGRRVICAGLDMDYQRQPFEITASLLAIADEVTKLTAVCACGQDAQFTRRIGEATGRIAVGGLEMYAPACRACYRKEETT